MSDEGMEEERFVLPRKFANILFAEKEEQTRNYPIVTEHQVLLKPSFGVPIKSLKNYTQIYHLIQLRSVTTREIKSKRYLTEIMFIIGERIPLKTD